MGSLCNMKQYYAVTAVTGGGFSRLKQAPLRSRQPALNSLTLRVRNSFRA